MRLAAAFIFAAMPAFAMEVPSGQPLALHEVLVDAQETQTWLRFRFIAPQIAVGDAQLSYEETAGDFAHLCGTMALPYIAEHALEGDVIVISMADREVPFGQADPDAVQYFEAFRIQDGACIWEDF